MKIVSFNIRCDYEQDGKNNFSNRKDLIAEKILTEQPDVIGFQEVLPHVATWLKETLEDYYVLGCGREVNLEDEQTAIAFKKTKYQLISMNTFWLSPEPHVPGSRYEQDQSICSRTCTEVLLEDLEAKKVIRILNLHLDHEGSQARVDSSKQVLRYLQNAKLFRDAPVILTGDFNALPHEPEITLLSEEGLLVDVTKDLGDTYHEYGQPDKYMKIDYIMTTEDIICKKAGLWEDEQDGVFLSDHYPVFAELEI